MLCWCRRELTVRCGAVSPVNPPLKTPGSTPHGTTLHAACSWFKLVISFISFWLFLKMCPKWRRVSGFFMFRSVVSSCCMKHLTWKEAAWPPLKPTHAANWHCVHARTGVSTQSHLLRHISNCWNASQSSWNSWVCCNNLLTNPTKCLRRQTQINETLRALLSPAERLTKALHWPYRCHFKWSLP